MAGIKSMDGCNPILITQDDTVRLLDQRLLPQREEYVRVDTVEDVAGAITDMVVRGAPLIGIVAAFGLYIAVRNAETKDEFLRLLDSAASRLASTRPTAVNLFYAIDLFLSELKAKVDLLELEKLKMKARALAFTLWDKQKKQDREIGRHGASYLKDCRRVLTHCNTGTLATGGIGTALGIIKTMHEAGNLDMVYVDETRPYLQGARLTAYELSMAGIPYRVITDSSCGMVARKGLIDAVVVGADRIAKNGDTANKIGTYVLACIARKHGIKFVVAAPESTIDRRIASLDGIPIEERDPDEVLTCAGRRVAPHDAQAINYSFDLTDGDLISAIVTEKGVYEGGYAF